MVRKSISWVCVVTALLASSVPSLAGPSPLGVWLEQSQRAAIEVSDCDGKLCGRIIWLRDQSDGAGCNVQVFGNARPVGESKWDKGWIINPEEDLNKKYDVEITALSDHKLKVMGYMGLKFLNETRIWTRTSANLKRCGISPQPVIEPPKPQPQREAQPQIIEPPAVTPTPMPERRTERVADRPREQCGFSLGSIKMFLHCEND